MLLTEDLALDKVKNPDLSNDQFLIERIIVHRETRPNESCFFRLGADCEVTEELTWDSWVTSAQQIAAFFSKNNIKVGDRVVLSLPNSLEYFISFLGLWWIGAIPVPVPEPSPKMKRNAFNVRLLDIIKDCTPKSIIVIDDKKQEILHSDYFLSVTKNKQIWKWEDILFTKNTEIQSIPHANHKEENCISFIQYTSGSTNKPKGVIVTHGMLRASCQAMGKACSMSSTDKVLNWMPLYHDMGLIGGALGPSYFNAKIFLMKTKLFISNPFLWLKSISDHKITVSLGPNFAYNLCATSINCKSLNIDLSSWRLAFNGAEHVWHDTITKFSKEFAKYGFKDNTFYPVYGMAEATLGITFPSPENPVIFNTVSRSELMHEYKAVEVNEKSEDCITFVSVGKCLPDHSLFIYDPTTDGKLGECEVGEICFSGPSVSPGYYNNKTDLFNSCSPGKVLYTGDLGYISNGNLYVVDRIKDLIKIAGASYYPSDIEKQIGKIDGVRNGHVAVFEVPDIKYQTGSLVIAAEINRHAEEIEIRNNIKDILYTFYKVLPDSIVLSKFQFIPFTSSGKVMRRSCREMYLSKTLLKTASY